MDGRYPGRTVVMGNAQIFGTIDDAKKALDYTIRRYPHRKLSGRGKTIKMAMVKV